MTKRKNTKKSTNKHERTHESFPINPKQTYTVQQIADWWQLSSTRTVLYAIRNSGLKAAKIGRSYMVLGSDALKFHEKMIIYRRPRR